MSELNKFISSNTYSNPLMTENILENREMSKKLTKKEIFNLSFNFGLYRVTCTY